MEVRAAIKFKLMNLYERIFTHTLDCPADQKLSASAAFSVRNPLALQQSPPKSQ